MKKPLTFSLFFATVLFFTSCGSSKDITMFQDFKNNVSLPNLPSEPPEYTIKAYDNLYLSILTLDSEVNVLFNPNLSGSGYGTGTQQMYGDVSSQYINGYMVSSEGIIALPIIGELNVLGLNLIEAEQLIKESASEYLKDPNVKVKVLNFRVNVTGEVRSPGIYYNYEGKLNIIDAISFANGITDYANVKDVLVIRQNQGNTKTYNLDLSNHRIYASEAFYLQPNDVVYVKPNKYKRTRENSTIYSLILSTISTAIVVSTLLIK